MTTQVLNPLRSEKGIALLVVLLLLGVLSGLTAGLAITGQSEVAMSANDVYYAGARAAAEAGLNRAVEKISGDTSTALLAGADGLWNSGNASDAVNADNGMVPVLGNGPYPLSEEYSYTFEILDDDDPLLYGGNLTNAQLVKMNEDNSPYTDVNNYLVLRATGFGPKNTQVTVSRILQSVPTTNVTTTTTTILSNPAILVNGNLDISGSAMVFGEEGNVHANGDITGGGSADIEGDMTATGTVSDAFDPGGIKAGNMPPINVPEIKAQDYLGLADWILTSTGAITHANGSACGAKTDPCPSGWSFSGGAWSASGGMPTAATYYAQTAVSMKGTGNSALTSLSVIAEGSITIEGNGKFRPENDSKIQFVTNGDFILQGNANTNDTTDTDGQIMVREQLKVTGNSKFQGRIMVEDRNSASNAYDASSNPNGRKGSSLLDTNTLSGNMAVEYNGSLGNIVSTITTTTSLPPTYTNNFSGWMEQ